MRLVVLLAKATAVKWAHMMALYLALRMDF